MGSPRTIARRLLITGRVQGVGYRYWLREQAVARGISGWVRNRADGSVEAIIAGEQAAVAATIAACRQGPHGAEVAGVTIEAAVGEAFDAFAIRPTERD